MSEMKKAVEQELKKFKNSKVSIKLWDEIFGYYEIGGPRSIKDNLKKKIAEIKKRHKG